MMTRAASRARLRLSPLGTVRERLAVFPAGTTPFPSWLQRAAVELELGEEIPYFAWELVRFVEGGSAVEREALLALVAASLVNVQAGKTRLKLATLDKMLAAMGAPVELGAAARAIVAKGELGTEILGGPDDPKPLILVGDEIVHQRIYERERDVKESLARRLASKAETPYEKLLDALDDILARSPRVDGRPRRLSTEQQHAVRTAASRHVSVITGGPGSGKTTIIASLLRVLVRIGVSPRRAALVAPTGKAARRIADAVRNTLRQVTDPGEPDRNLLEHCPEPMTIHRLLTRPDIFHLQALVVDEASMIDLDLMARLLEVVPESARLVFLGDPEQLPPIAPGSVFRETLSVSSGAIALGETYRLDPSAVGGRNLRHVAKAVRALDVEPLFHPDSRAGESIAVRVSAGDLQFRGVELFEGEREDFLERWNRELIQTPEYRDLARRDLVLARPLGELERETLARLQSLLDAQQILCVTNLDVRRINERLGAAGYVRPIIAIRNDLDRGLVNGESGMLVRDQVIFPCGEMDPDTADDSAFDLSTRESLGAEIALAFAITVHKSQGSEYDHVALVLPEPEHPLLSRQLLYTAITRARKSLTLVGKKEAVIAAVGRSL